MSLSKSVSEAYYGERNTMIGLAWAFAFQLGQRVWPTIEMDKLSPLLPYFVISPSGSEFRLALAFI